jgi:hypothetical protein
MAPHQNHWFTNTDDQLMKEYIARHQNQLPLQELEDLKCNFTVGDVTLS